MEFDYLVMGQVIRDLRKEKKLSQEVLSGLAGIARSHLSMIENAAIHANIETIWKLAQALEVHPAELFTEIEKALKE